MQLAYRHKDFPCTRLAKIERKIGDLFLNLRYLNVIFKGLTHVVKIETSKPLK